MDRAIFQLTLILPPKNVLDALVKCVALEVAFPILLHKHWNWASPCGVITKVVDGSLGESEFELQSFYFYLLSDWYSMEKFELSNPPALC